VTWKAAIVLPLVLLTGCRSDGGVDRIDTVQGMSFAVRSLRAHQEADVAATKKHLASAPDYISKTSADGIQSLRNTYQLYFDAHEPRQ
jgi:outer membrane murein-binding lipoprotein Lpp